MLTILINLSGLKSMNIWERITFLILTEVNYGDIF